MPSSFVNICNSNALASASDLSGAIASILSGGGTNGGDGGGGVSFTFVGSGASVVEAHRTDMSLPFVIYTSNESHPPNSDGLNLPFR